MSIAAIDPGLAAVGVAWQTEDGYEADVWIAGPADTNRAGCYAEWFSDLIRDEGITALGIETQYVDFAARGSARPGRAQGQQAVVAVAAVLEYVATQMGVEVHRVAPATAKRALTGCGKASKAQMVEAAGRLLGRKLLRREEHAADAIGVLLATEGLVQVAAQRARREANARRAAEAVAADAEAGA